MAWEDRTPFDAIEYQYGIKENQVRKLMRENLTESSFKLLDSIKHKNITRVYPHKFFCNNTIKNRCITHNQKEIFYFDHNHLSSSGTKYIINLIFESIKN